MKNPIWFLLWLLILIFISFIVAFIGAFFYIYLYMLEACCDCWNGINNFLLKCVQFPHYCAEAMLECRSPF